MMESFESFKNELRKNSAKFLTLKSLYDFSLKKTQKIFPPQEEIFLFDDENLIFQFKNDENEWKLFL